MNPYLIPGLKRKPSKESILDYLAEYYQVSKKEIVSKDRKTAKIKREAMYLMKTELKIEDSEIAKLFNCNRSSVFRSIQKQQAFIKVYPEVREQMKELKKKF